MLTSALIPDYRRFATNSQVSLLTYDFIIIILGRFCKDEIPLPLFSTSTKATHSFISGRDIYYK